MKENDFDIVVIIVDKKYTEKILDAVETVGVTGSTILPGRGRSANSKVYLLGIPIEQQREFILFMVPRSKTAEVFQIALDLGELNKPNQGLVFVLEVKQVGGLCFPAGN